MGGGFGGGPWGGIPWGGALPSMVSPPTVFDVFCFEDASMFLILTDPLVSTHGDPLQFEQVLVDLDMRISSGGGLYSAVDGAIFIDYGISAVFTTQWTIKFEALPTNFTNISHEHIYLAVTDGAGALVGFCFSKSGVLYTGSVSFPTGFLQLDTAAQILPGSSTYVNETDSWVIRAAADYNLGIVYFYMTRESDIAITGHQLRAILPVIPYDTAASTPVDEGVVSVCGEPGRMIRAKLGQFCVSSSLLIPNLAPVANAGADQATRTCSVIQLDGSQSFDPEGAPLYYWWRLIDAPSDSIFVVSKADGATYPLAIPIGFTDKFHSVALGAVDSVDPIIVSASGDVLLLGGVAYTLVGKGTDGSGFYVQIGQPLLVDNLVTQPFRVLRQRGISNPLTMHPTFLPDKPAFYRFDLTVSDGALLSSESVVIVNVLESPLPRGCTPDLRFLFEYLSDFWNLVEGRDRISTFWSALAQVAATELFTLWQYEYCKSLRDIQRVFTRRWLHYDPLLAEPLAELTKFHIVFGGVTSQFIAAGGMGGIQGTVLGLTSATLGTVERRVTITSIDPVSPVTLAAEIRVLLSVIDNRITTTVVTDRFTGHEAVRIDAPFPLKIGPSTTVPIFTVGAEDLAVEGSGGSAVGVKVYKVDRSLQDLDIREDDLLALGGVAYRVVKTIDDINDQYPYQRVQVKEAFLMAPSGTWHMNGWVSSELLDFYNGLVSEGDLLDLEAYEVDSTKASTTAAYAILSGVILGVNETLTGRASADLWALGTALANTTMRVGLARVLRRTYLPIDSLIVDIPTLQQLIVIEDDTQTLRRNVDFYLEDYRGHHCLRFSSGCVGDAGDVWEAGRPPDRLWAEYSYLDNSPVIEANFGLAVDFDLDDLASLSSTVDYLSAVRGLAYTMTNGPTLYNLRVGAQILLGLPFAEEAGVITEIRTDFSPTQGRILIQDTANKEIVRTYTFPKVLDLEVSRTTGEVYAVGDKVPQFAPLVEGVVVEDYVSNPTWFQGLLQQGAIYEVEKFHRFLVQVDASIFNLSALLFVRSFVLKLKPTYTFPLFMIRKEIGETEINTTDEISYSALLSLYDSIDSSALGEAFMFDEPRAGGGGWRSAYDTGPNPAWAPPVYLPPIHPTVFISHSPIAWAFDRGYLCPIDTVVISLCETFAAKFTPEYDSVFCFDVPPGGNFEYSDALPGVIPLVGFTLTPVGSNTITANGNLLLLTFIALGTPGLDPVDYFVEVLVNGVVQVSLPFVDGVNTEVALSFAVPVVPLDVIDVLVRPGSGAVGRTPTWTQILASVWTQNTTMWTFDDALDPGVYCMLSPPLLPPLPP